MNENENAVLDDEDLDFDELEQQLEAELEEDFSDLEMLKEDREKIGNPDSLGDVVMNVVWEQFMNQMAATAGEDFIKENNGLHLDLRNEAHIQTTENFAEGKIATHNTEINYQKRYDDWQSNFVKDKNGNVVTHKTRSGKDEATLVKGARKPFDEGRPSGSADKHTDMDHTVSASEIIRDPAANAHMTKEEQIAFANSEKNLNEMDSSMNRSKGDKSMDEWLDNPNANGQKPDEIFDISAEDEAKLRQKDAEAREEYEKQKKEGEQKSIEAGKKSQKEEAFRIGGKALRAALTQLLAELVKEMIGKLVKWFKSAQRTVSTLLDNLKEAIHSFIGKMKTHLINAADTVFTTVATAIKGPIVRTIKKAWMLLKQGWNSLKEAVNYLRDPANKGKPLDILLMEVGKIVIAGLTGAGALMLGEVIEKGLTSIPIFAFEIPLFGSLASVLGNLLGAVVAGIVGALAMNLIEKWIAKKQREEAQAAVIDKGNKVISDQHKLQIVYEAKLDNTKANVQSNISGRHQEAETVMKDAFENIMKDVSREDTAHAADEEDIKTNAKIDKAMDDLDNLIASLT